MEYLVVGMFMRRFETKGAESAEEACALGRDMFERSASAAMVLDLEGNAWPVDIFCQKMGDNA